MPKTNNKSSIEAYARDLERWVWPPNEQPVSDPTGSPVIPTGRVKRVLRQAVPASTLDLLQMVCTRLVMPMTARRMVQRAGSGQEVRMQFACGSCPLAGWINIDLVGSSADFFWDLRRPVPLEDGSVDAIYHEHFFEHLPFAAALGNMREARRLLRPGGVLRFGVPDFGRYSRSYVAGDAFLEELKPERPTACLAINELMYWYGHRSMWDEETLVQMVEELGFVDVGRRDFGDSALDPCPDWDLHESETLYIEARQP